MKAASWDIVTCGKLYTVCTMKKYRTEKPQNTAMFKSILDDSARTRIRANNLNAIEEDRLRKMNKIIEKERRHRENIRLRVLNRTEKTLKEKNSLQRVLSSDYRVDNFMTMKKGFKKPLYQPPKEARRFKVETRIYHSGFGVRSLRPEINQRMRQVDPNTVQRIIQKVLAEKCLELNDVPVERSMPDPELYQNLFDRAMQTDRTIKRRSDVLHHSLREVTPTSSSRISVRPIESIQSPVLRSDNYIQSPVPVLEKSGRHKISDNKLRDIQEISVKQKKDKQINVNDVTQISVRPLGKMNKIDDLNNDFGSNISVRPLSKTEHSKERISTNDLSIRPKVDICNCNNQNEVGICNCNIQKGTTFNQTNRTNYLEEASRSHGYNSPSKPIPSIHVITEEEDEHESYDIRSSAGNSQDDNSYTAGQSSSVIIEKSIDTNGKNFNNVDAGDKTNERNNRLNFLGGLLEESEDLEMSDNFKKNVKDRERNLDRTQTEQTESGLDQWQFKTSASEDGVGHYYT